MKQASTWFLRIAVFLFAAVIFAACVAIVPFAVLSDAAGIYRPIFIGLYVPAIPFFFAIYQTFKLLHYIDTNTTFSDSAVTALRNIKRSGIAISTLYALGIPFVARVAEQDDAPGVILVVLSIIFTSVAIAVFAAVLERLLRSAIDIKKENELTV